MPGVTHRKEPKIRLTIIVVEHNVTLQSVTLIQVVGSEISIRSSAVTIVKIGTAVLILAMSNSTIVVELAISIAFSDWLTDSD